MAEMSLAEGLALLLRGLEPGPAQLEAAGRWCEQMSIQRIQDFWEVAGEDEWAAACEAMQLLAAAGEALLARLRQLRAGELRLGEEAPPPKPKPKYPPLAPLQQRLEAIEAQGLEANRYELDLSDEPVGDEGLQRLVKGLESNSGLRQLRLQRCGITVAGLAPLGGLLYEGGRRAIAQQQQSFPGSSPEQGGTGMLKGSADTLEELILSGNEVGCPGLGRDFCESLSVAVNLRVLSLACCSLGDAGVVGLFEVLSHRTRGDKTACGLQELDISHNNLGPATARALVHVLACNEHLRVLHAKANEFGPEGALAMADCIRANKGRLQRFDLSQNGFLLEGARAILAAFVSPVAFVVRVFRPPGHPTGATLSADMKVMGVLPHSIIDKWSTDNPAEEIRSGDYVVRVNDTRTPKLMNLELGEQQDLEIALHRPGASLAYLDISYNGILLPGVQELHNEIGRFSGSSLQGALLVWPEGRQVSLNAA